MRIPILTSVLVVGLFGLSSSAFAQRGKPGDPEHRDVHRNLSAVEAELRSLIDKREAWVKRSYERAVQIRELNRELTKQDGKDKRSLTNQIQDLALEDRRDARDAALDSIAMQRLQLEMESLARYDAHIIEEGGQTGFKPFVRAPQIKSISIIKEERGSPGRITGVGYGFYTTRTYEVIFSDGSRQRIQSKDFTPTQRR